MSEKIDVEKMAAHFERVINNLNQHWSSIQLLLGCVSKPLNIDDRGLRTAFQGLTEKMQHIYEKLNNMLQEVDKIDISQTFSEIKYIGKRLSTIESLLSQMKEEGIQKKINLEFTLDGYTMVKKPKVYEYDTPVENSQNDDLIKLFATLVERESRALVLRYGLLGEKKHTFDQMSIVMKVTRERCRQIVAKALRKCKHESRKQLVQKIKHKDLIKDILGECSSSY